MKSVLLISQLTTLFNLSLLTLFCRVHQKYFKSPIASRMTRLWIALLVWEASYTLSFLGVKEWELFAHVLWIVPLNYFLFSLQDWLPEKLKGNWFRPIFLSGLCGTMVFYLQNKSLTQTLLPLDLGFLIITLVILISGIRILIKDMKSHRSLLFISITFFILMRNFFFLSPDFLNRELVEVLIFHGLLFLVFLAFIFYEFKIFIHQHDDQLESQLKKRNEQLLNQSKYSELGMMSAGIAHEINNPLTVIQAKVTQMLRFYKDKNRIREIGEGLEQLLYTSERINRTIQGIREFVHQDENSLADHFALKTLVEDVLAFCGQRFKNHGISLRLYGFDHYMIYGHKIQLEQVLLNLLNNSFDAIEFLPEKWIEISVQETDSSIILTLKDSGPGIPHAVAEKMMDAFYTTKTSGKGTGLGLPLARGIIEKHGGSLRYLSDSPHTTFQIELPKNYDFQAVKSGNHHLMPLH